MIEEIEILRGENAEAETVIRDLDVSNKALARLALNIRIALARREGYIDRVREFDEAGSPGPIQNPAPGELLEDLQNAMSTADDASFDRIVSAMSPETLNKILGRDNADDPDVLR